MSASLRSAVIDIVNSLDVREWPRRDVVQRGRKAALWQSFAAKARLNARQYEDSAFQEKTS
jgi:hypothetical protein